MGIVKVVEVIRNIYFEGLSYNNLKVQVITQDSLKAEF